jgi:hypothetical protein
VTTFEFEVIYCDPIAYCAHPTSTTVAERNIRIPQAFREADKQFSEMVGAERGLGMVRYRRTSGTTGLDVEAGWTVPAVIPVQPPCVSEILPGGLYAIARFDAPYTGLEKKAQALLAWGAERDLDFDVDRRPDGDWWGCRYDLHFEEPTFGPHGPSGRVDVRILLRR